MTGGWTLGTSNASSLFLGILACPVSSGIETSGEEAKKSTTWRRLRSVPKCSDLTAGAWGSLSWMAEKISTRLIESMPRSESSSMSNSSISTGYPVFSATTFRSTACNWSLSTSSTEDRIFPGFACRPAFFSEIAVATREGWFSETGDVVTVARTLLRTAATILSVLKPSELGATARVDEIRPCCCSSNAWNTCKVLS